MEENKRDLLFPRIPRRKINIRAGDPATPVIFLVGEIPYKADVSAETFPGFIPGVELTVREDMLVKMILAGREGQVALAVVNEALPEQWADLKKAFNDLLTKVCELTPAPEEVKDYFTSAEYENILRWQERLK